MPRPRPTSFRRVVLIVLLAVCTAMPACQTVYHTVGAGATGGEFHETTQWYAFWGLLPLGGAPDVRELAREQVNYTAYDGFDTLDVFLNFFTVWLSFYRKTISVEY